MILYNNQVDTHSTYLNRDTKAVSENPSKPQIDALTTTNHTAFSGVCVSLLNFFQSRDPGRALSRANANTTREAPTTSAAPATYLQKWDKRGV
jgi:hypothetical protein